jgi:hypothetical protein
VPEFIKDIKLTQKILLANISQGISLDHANQILKCIDLEYEAHSRLGAKKASYKRKLKLKEMKKRQ